MTICSYVSALKDSVSSDIVAICSLRLAIFCSRALICSMLTVGLALVAVVFALLSGVAIGVDCCVFCLFEVVLAIVKGVVR